MESGSFNRRKINLNIELGTWIMHSISEFSILCVVVVIMETSKKMHQVIA